MTHHYDFRGGYATDLAPERMDDNMVGIGTNVRYRGKMESRPGWTNLSTDATLHANTIRGAVRAYINGGWYNVVALDIGGAVNFYYGDTGAYTSIDATYDWTTGKNVEMVAFNDAVVAVNGTDKPAVIYYSAGWVVKNLETYDTRTRGTDEWFAGAWDDSASPEFIDDTADAQSDTANDYLIATGGVANDGFYVACSQIFNKVVIKSCPAFDGSPVAEYAYYAGSGSWTTFTPGTVPSWGAAEADKTIEFDLPLDGAGELLWEKYGDLDSQSDALDAAGETVAGGALNEYILRVRFTTAPTSDQSADYLVVSHTQYLTQIFLDDRPSAVAVHRNRLFLATGRAFRYNAPNQLTGWDSRDIEYCLEGGEEILAMTSAADYLAVFKEAGVYRYIGTTTENFTLRFTPCAGASSPRGVATVGGNPVYVATDGLRAFVGERSVILSRHIQSDFDSWTSSDAVVLEWEGNILVSFPTDAVMLWADPDTMRADDMGDGRLSLWKWTGLAADIMMSATGSGDNGYLICADSANARFVRNTANGYDVAFDTSQTAITQTLQGKYYSYGTPTTKKAWRRIKVETSKSGDYTLTILGNNGDASVSATIASGTGTGHSVKTVSVPYTLDGYNLSIKLVNDTTNSVEIYGYAIEYKRRAF